MVLSCKIHVEKPQGGMYRSGETVKGIISYEIDNPAKYKIALVSLIGEAKCKWHDSGRKQTYSGKDVFLSLDLSILNKLPEEKTMPAGKHDFRFKFDLPYKIPSSFKDKNSSITYELQVKFKKASYFSLTQIYKEPITIYGYIVPPKVEKLTYELQKIFHACFVPNGWVIDVKLQIDKTFFSPGDNINLDFFVNNDSNRDILYFLIELYGRTTCTGQAILKTTKEFDRKIQDSAGTGPPVLSYKTRNFTCIIPIPSDIYSIRNCKIINVSYYLQVTMQLERPYNKKSIMIPIVVGHSRDGDTSIMEETEGLILKPSNGAGSEDDIMERIAGHGCLCLGLICMANEF